MAKTNKKNSAKRKLIPAVSMLTVSAVMLSTATYAWFTMSREVEVKNIQMTATVPEDIQISLGTLGNAKNTAVGDGTYSLKDGTGVLVNTTEDSYADNGAVTAPTGDNDKTYYWSNTADISKYYQFGKLIPASSATGANIFFTPDADGVGKTVKADAQFIKASGATPGGAAVADSSGGSYTYAATAHAFTDTAQKSWSDWSNSNTTGYKQSTQYNVTNDDGYYVDIPVWLRTSSTDGADLAVEAYVIPNDSNIRLSVDNKALYKAIRVAILDPGDQSDGNTVTPSNLLPVHDGWTGMTQDAYGNISATPFTGTSVNDWYGGAKTADVVADTAGTLTGGRFGTNVYGPATEYSGLDTTVVSLAKGTGTTYGNAAKVIVRVWLEGEDPDCWNDTAGQNWSINLKFVKKNSTSTGKDISDTATTPAQNNQEGNEGNG